VSPLEAEGRSFMRCRAVVGTFPPAGSAGRFVRAGNRSRIRSRAGVPNVGRRTWCSAAAHRSAQNDSAGSGRYYRHKVAQEALRRAKSIFANRENGGRRQACGGIAHDFNNLLTAIIAIAACFGDGLAGDDPLSSRCSKSKSAGRGRPAHATVVAFSRRQILQPKVLDLNSSWRISTGMLRLLRGRIIRGAVDS